MSTINNNTTDTNTIDQPKPKKKKGFARCPNCGKRGGVIASRTIRTTVGRHRQRSCKLCGYFFETEMHLPLECPYCDEFNNFVCRNTLNLRNGVQRLYQCRECKRYTPTFESFPIPEERRRRPDFRNYD